MERDFNNKAGFSAKDDKLPKRLLGPAVAYDGTHDRLRAVGADYLRRR